MLNRKIALTIMVLTILPSLTVLTPVHALKFHTVQLGVSGQGVLNWVGMYHNSIYTSGTTISNLVITVPEGTDLTFTATPQSHASFSYWVLDQSSQVSTNPYVIASVGIGSPVYHTIFANFDQSLAPNPPLKNLQYNVFNLDLSGSGEVYWSSSYNGATSQSGWVDSSSSIAIPKGATVTLTAVPLNGDHFISWVINGVDQGSNNPYTLSGTGENSYANIVAYFDQTFYANPPLQSSQYDTIQVNVQGTGSLHWSINYESVYDSGVTNTASSIVVPHGATVTFTAVSMNGSHFSNWMVNSANAGSTNPYVMHNRYVAPASTVMAVFTQN